MKIDIDVEQNILNGVAAPKKFTVKIRRVSGQSRYYDVDWIHSLTEDELKELATALPELANIALKT